MPEFEVTAKVVELDAKNREQYISALEIAAPDGTKQLLDRLIIIRHIEAKEALYYVRAEGGPIYLRVVYRRDGRQYLRTASNDSAMDNLDKLPDALPPRNVEPDFTRGPTRQIVEIPEEFDAEHHNWHVPGTHPGFPIRKTQIGTPGAGVEFLQFHRDFVNRLRAWYSAQPGADMAAIAPWLAIPVELKVASVGWNPARQAQEQRLTNNLTSFASEDELGTFIELGIHAWLHDAAARIYSEPILKSFHSPESTYFYQLHGLVDFWWSEWQRISGQPSAPHAPRASGDPITYAYGAAGASQEVLYRGADSHIQELWYDGQWHHQDLTALLGAPNAAGNPSAYTLPSALTEILYVSADGHIQEYWYDTAWHHLDLTAAINSPIAIGDVVTYAHGVIQEVFYRGIDGHLHEMWYDSSWHHQDLNGLLGLPPMAGDPAAFATGNGIHEVIYRGADGHIHEVWYDGQWHYQDLSSITAAHSAIGDPVTYPYGPGQQEVIYCAASGNIGELWYDGAWHFVDLTAALGLPACSGELLAYTYGPSYHEIVFRSADGHLHELWFDTEWHHQDLTAATGSPVAAGVPSGFTTPSGLQELVYRAQDGRVMELWYDSGWHVQQLSV